MFATSLTACTVSAQASGQEVPIAAGQHTKHGCLCHALQADANLVRHVAAFSGFASAASDVFLWLCTNKGMVIALLLQLQLQLPFGFTSLVTVLLAVTTVYVKLS